VPAKVEAAKEKQGAELAKAGIDMVASLYTEMRTPGVA